MIFAVIPAAGKSTRMGRPKLSLPLGEKSVLEHVVDALRGAAIEHILVVIGPHVAELAPIARAAGADTLLLPEETPDMRTSIELGLDWIEEHFHPDSGDPWLLLPADCPMINEEVVRKLLQASSGSAKSSIVIPTYQGKRGHPTLLKWKHVSEIRSLGTGLGLNAFIRKHASTTLEVPVDSVEILRDLDTPDDYKRLTEDRQRSRKP